MNVATQYVKKLPLFLKGVLKAKDRIYFASLSVPVEDAHTQLVALKNKDFQSLYKSETEQKPKKQRRADLLLVLMLACSGALSFGIDYLIALYPTASTNNLLMRAGKFVDGIARIFGTGNATQRTSQEKYEMALFFIPFSILAIISFIVYFRLLKGKIEEE